MCVCGGFCGGVCGGVCECVVSVIVKCPALPSCMVDGALYKIPLIIIDDF